MTNEDLTKEKQHNLQQVYNLEMQTLKYEFRLSLKSILKRTAKGIGLFFLWIVEITLRLGLIYMIVHFIIKYW